MDQSISNRVSTLAALTQVLATTPTAIYIVPAGIMGNLWSNFALSSYFIIPSVTQQNFDFKLISTKAELFTTSNAAIENLCYSF